MSQAPQTPSHLSSFFFQQTPEKETDRNDCAVCLSPLERLEREVAETRCHHFFHLNCLHEVKARGRSQCPVCRGALTPLATVNSNQHNQINNNNNNLYLSHFASSSGASSLAYPLAMRSGQREEIVSAARRGREAVRLALERRGVMLNS